MKLEQHWSQKDTIIKDVVDKLHIIADKRENLEF